MLDGPINKQRSEANLINDIKEKYGENCKMIMGVEFYLIR